LPALLLISTARAVRSCAGNKLFVNQFIEIISPSGSTVFNKMLWTLLNSGVALCGCEPAPFLFFTKKCASFEGPAAESAGHASPTNPWQLHLSWQWKSPCWSLPRDTIDLVPQPGSTRHRGLHMHCAPKAHAPAHPCSP
jgi:hypothetical protein